MDDKQIGQRLRDIRKNLKVSQKYLGDSIGVTFQQIQKYESGLNRLSGSAAYKIAEALEIKVSNIFPDDPNTTRFGENQEVGFHDIIAFQKLCIKDKLIVINLINGLSDVRETV